MEEQDLKQIEAMMTRVVGVFAEDFQHKLDLVVEGHQVLRSEIQNLGRKTDERFDLVDFKIDTLNLKIDAVTADLSAHRVDTEVHAKGWQVRED